MRQRAAPSCGSRPGPTVLLPVLAAVLLLPAPALAQDGAHLAGRVLHAASERPVVGARIELVDVRGRSVGARSADADGSFAFEDLEPGQYQLRASSLGYADVRTPDLPLQAADSTEVIVWMDVEAVPLAPLEVVVGRPPEHRAPGLRGLYERSRSGLGGHVLLREEIEERSPTRVTDAMIMVGSLAVTQGGIFNERSQCAPAVYIDGVVVSGTQGRTTPMQAYEAANMVSPYDVEGIEVYTAATVPGQFGGPRAACGVILIWLRRG